MFRPVVTLLVLFSFCLSTSCTGVLFQPIKQHFQNPDIVNIQYSDIYIESDEGLKLHGWKLLTQNVKKGSVLFIHGNGENISTHFANLYWMIEHGYDGYIFDYRGYGKSEGIPELDGVVRDVYAMLDYVVNQVNADQRVIVIGHSMGGALAINAVAGYNNKKRILTLVTVEAFSDYQDITQDVLARNWLTWLIQWPLSLTINNSYSPVDVIAKVSPVPLLIMHSRDDVLVSLEHAMILYEAASNPKQFIEISGDHSHVFDFEVNRSLLLEYLGGL